MHRVSVAYDSGVTSSSCAAARPGGRWEHLPESGALDAAAATVEASFWELMDREVCPW
jgi:hypothetical protein